MEKARFLSKCWGKGTIFMKIAFKNHKFHQKSRRKNTLHKRHNFAKGSWKKCEIYQSTAEKTQFRLNILGKKWEFCQRIAEICTFSQKIEKKKDKMLWIHHWKFLKGPWKRCDLCENSAEKWIGKSIAVKHGIVKKYKFHERISGITWIMAKEVGINMNFIKKSLKKCRQFYEVSWKKCKFLQE